MSINGNGSTTTTQKSEPFNGVQPYLYGTSSTPGVLPESMKQYQAGGWTPGMQDLTSNQYNTVGARTQNQAASSWQLGADLLNRQYDPTITAASSVHAQTVDPTQAFGSLGAANPTGSIQQMLTGQVNTQYLNPLANSLTALSNQNLQQSVLPSINNEAFAAGQYGGTRQGIAQGVAIGNAQTGLNNSIANLYNNAYQQAQNNMYGTANNMAGLGLSNAQQNATRDLQAQSANAQIQLQNNAQQMALKQQQLGNSQAAMQSFQNAANVQDSGYAQQMALQQAPANYGWNNLNNYAAIIGGGARLGGTTSTTTPYFTNPVGNALSLGFTGLSLYNGLNNAGLLGGSGSSTPIATTTASADQALQNPYYNDYVSGTAGGY